jgi:hypothetical protein
MVAISQEACDRIKGNNKIIGRMMHAFDKHWTTIDRWAEEKDSRLTTPTAVQIISEETGLTKEEILEESVLHK